MEKPSPKMRRALRQAHLYGYLIARYNGLGYPGSDQATCGSQTAKEMVRSGWLVLRGDGRYEITSNGRRVAGFVTHV
jgi:hypothetical protein